MCAVKLCSFHASHLKVTAADFVSVFFKCVSVTSFSLCPYNFHGTCYGPVRIPRV